MQRFVLHTYMWLFDKVLNIGLLQKNFQEALWNCMEKMHHACTNGNETIF